nr:MFS transporter [Burkholderia ambifaria]
MVILMFLTWVTVFLGRMVQLYLAPFFAPELKINAEQVGILASTLVLAWALSSFIFSAISDRRGRRPVLIPMVFAFSLLSWVSGFARNFQQMLLVRGVMGVAEGPYWSVMNAVVEQSSRPKRRNCHQCCSRDWSSPRSGTYDPGRGTLGVAYGRLRGGAAP